MQEMNIAFVQSLIRAEAISHLRAAANKRQEERVTRPLPVKEVMEASATLTKGASTIIGGLMAVILGIFWLGLGNTKGHD